MARIYISSTYEDLVEYRKAVYQVLRELRHDALQMEDYTAADTRPLKKCLEDVAASNLYIGILAWRYGYVPDDKERNKQSESITALEYRHAHDKGIPTLLFLLNEDTPWSPKFHDANNEPDYGGRIKAFRNKVKHEHIVTFFSTPDELGRKVATAVKQWEKENTPTKTIAPLETQTDDSIPDDSMAWGIKATRAEKSPYTGEGITVAILSTGVDTAHEAFQGIAFTVKDFTGEGTNDTYGLGTHAAGIIFGRPVEGMRIGIAPGITRALVAKVVDMTGGSNAKTLANAVLWAVENGAQIISLDLGIDFSSFLGSLIDAGMKPELAASKMIDSYRYNLQLFESIASTCSASCLLIAPVGNESQRDMSTGFVCGAALPAAAKGFISVGAVKPTTGFPHQLEVASFSNSGADVVAPGVSIPSAKLGGSVTTMSGTSMATNHVTGIAALWAQQIINTRGSLSISELSVRLRGQASISAMQAGVSIDDVGSGIVQAPLK